MHYKIDCIERLDNCVYHINEILREPDGGVLGGFGPSKLLSRIKMNTYLSDYAHNGYKKANWKIKVY